MKRISLKLVLYIKMCFIFEGANQIEIETNGFVVK